MTWVMVGCLWVINTVIIFPRRLHSLLSFIILKWIFIKRWKTNSNIGQEKLILEKLPSSFQVTISFSSYLWQTVENALFPAENVIHFCHSMPLSLKNSHALFQKIHFSCLFRKILFFFLKKFINEKYSESHLMFVSRCSLPLKQSYSPTNDFLQFFQKILPFLKNLFNNKISGN